MNNSDSTNTASTSTTTATCHTPNTLPHTCDHVQDNGNRHKNRKQKRKRLSESETKRSRRHVDYTQTCAVDVLLYMTTFIEDKEARSFAHTSKSNLAALRRYEYKGSLDIVGHLLKYSRSLGKNGDNCGRSIFHPQFAFGQWKLIYIDFSQLQVFHSWRSNASNQSSVKLLVDYIRSREMMKLNSLSQSLIVTGYVEDHTLVTLKWLIQLFALRPYKLTNIHQWYESFLTVEELKLLRDAIPGWNHIQVLHIGEVNLNQNPVTSNFAFPSSLTDLRIRASGNQDDWSHIVLPTSLKRLVFSLSQFQFASKWPQMPSTLETLVLHGYAHSLKNYRLPSSLTHLQIDPGPAWPSDAPDLSLKECPLPSTLKLLKLPDYWNLPIEELGKLPNSLEILEFGNGFNQPVDRLKLPPSLQSLYLGRHFDRSIDKLNLPQSLAYLSFGLFFNQLIRGDIFPPQLKSLIFGDYFNQPIRDWKLPNSLTHLEFSRSFSQPISDFPLDYWPSSLISLRWYQHARKWHRSISSDTSLALAGSKVDFFHIALSPTYEQRVLLTCIHGHNKVLQMIENMRQAQIDEDRIKTQLRRTRSSK